MMFHHSSHRNGCAFNQLGKRISDFRGTGRGGNSNGIAVGVSATMSYANARAFTFILMVRV